MTCSLQINLESLPPHTKIMAAVSIITLALDRTFPFSTAIAPAVNPSFRFHPKQLNLSTRAGWAIEKNCVRLSRTNDWRPLKNLTVFNFDFADYSPCGGIACITFSCGRCLLICIHNDAPHLCVCVCACACLNIGHPESVSHPSLHAIFVLGTFYCDEIRHGRATSFCFFFRCSRSWCAFIEFHVDLTRVEIGRERITAKLDAIKTDAKNGHKCCTPFVRSLLCEHLTAEWI